MLETLEVKNFAIIEDITINFFDNLNVLTGETGAGKSLIIDSLELICGKRADLDMIRKGKDFTSIKATFNNLTNEIKSFLENFNIEVLDKLTIYREIKTNGKNICKINNVSVNNQTLKLLGDLLIDFHTQNDIIKLLNPETYLSFLDKNNDKLFSDTYNNYVLNYNLYKETLNELNDLINKRDENNKKLSTLNDDKEFLSKFNLNYETDINVKEELIKLKNSDKIYNVLKNSYEALNNSLLDPLYDLTKELDNISEYSNSYLSLLERVNNSYYELDDVKSLIYDELNSFNFDEYYYNSLIERYNDLKMLKDKYKKDLKELCDYYNYIEYEIEKITNFDDVVKRVTNKLNDYGKKAYDFGLKLRSIRQDYASVLEKEIIKECKELDFKDVRFKIIFNEIEEYKENYQFFNDNGLDIVDFTVSFNVGENLLSLYKVASGGELSRLMLAFKKIYSIQRKFSLFIFDEIDTGVSGEASLMIAKKISEIASYNQVLCITHMLSVACAADHNFYIYKTLDNDRTYTNVKELDGEEKIITLSKMISGNLINEAAISHTRSLIKQSKKI